MIYNVLLALAVAGATASPPNSLAPRGGARGMGSRGQALGEDPYDLLTEALAPPDVAYKGSVVVEFRTAGKPAARRLLDVHYAPPGRYHRVIKDGQGRPERVVVSDGATEWTYVPSKRRAWKGPPQDPDAKVLGPEEELELLRRNYNLRIAGRGRVAGRPAWIVEVLPRSGGPVVRRLWVDQEHGLLLRSESFGSVGEPATSMVFSALTLPVAGNLDEFRFVPPEGTSVAPAPIPSDYMEVEDLGLETDAAPRMPAWLPPGYALESAGLIPAGRPRRGRRQVVHMRFSDGLDVLSLFQVPPGVRFGARGRPHERLRKGSLRARLYLEGDSRVLMWRSGRERLILMGRLSADELLRMAESIR